MLYEILFYGRGGQGAVTASNILVQAAIYENKYGQGFPFFGAERRGAPVTAYARISDRQILKHGMFNEADIVIVLDDSLLKLGVVKKARIRDKGILILNTSSMHIDRENINAAPGVRIYAVDASSIARRLGLVLAGWPLVNTPMLGAFSRATGLISMNSIEKALIDYFGTSAGKRNAIAATYAYEELKYIGEV